MQWIHLKNWGIKMKVLLYGYGLMGKKVAHQLRTQEGFMYLMKKHQKQCTII